jgi:hypothetical protein
MEGKKIYLQSAGTLIDVINDIAELQRAKFTFSDTPNGVIHFRVAMYGFKYELCFEVTDIGENRCQVLIETDANEVNREKWIRREFALLDAMLIMRAQIEFSASEKKLHAKGRILRT